MFRFTFRKAPSTASNQNDRAIEVDFLRNEVARLLARIHELECLAGQDALVKLPNRRAFHIMLQNVIDRVGRYDEQAALIFIDVDGLKEINDVYGHVVGDAALVRISELIVESVRNSDHVGRLGGDEFAVVLEHSSELEGWEMALRIVEHVCAAQWTVGGHSVELSVAVGVGSIRADDDAAAVLTRADAQMYRIKRSSRKDRSMRK